MCSTVCAERRRPAAGLANEEPRANPAMLMKVCGTHGEQDLTAPTSMVGQHTVCACVRGLFQYDTDTPALNSSQC